MTTHTDVLAVTGARKKFGDVVALDGATLLARQVNPQGPRWG